MKGTGWVLMKNDRQKGKNWPDGQTISFENASFTQIRFMKFNPAIRSLVILLIVFANTGCDQISKAVVRENVQFHEQIELYSDNFILTKVENRGAFFGLGENLPPLVKNVALSLVPILAMLAILTFTLTREGLPKVMVFGLACMVGGGIGNIFDRVVHGSVTDFLHINLGGIFKTGIFNLADVSIMFGLLVIVFGAFNQPRV
jgi:signal peptidase II